MKFTVSKPFMLAAIVSTVGSIALTSAALAGGNPGEPVVQSQRERVQPKEDYQPPVMAEAQPVEMMKGFEPFWEIGGYLGYVKAWDTGVETTLTTPRKFDTGWKEFNSDSPYNWGLRATRWYQEGRGVEVDYSQSRFKADLADIVPAGLSKLELERFSSLAVSHIWRFDQNPIFTMSPYAGLGASIDYVRLEANQIGGMSVDNGEPAGFGLNAKLGLAKAITEKASLFAETRYSTHMLEVDASRQNFDFDLELLAVNLGLSFSF